MQASSFTQISVYLVERKASDGTIILRPNPSGEKRMGSKSNCKAAERTSNLVLDESALFLQSKVFTIQVELIFLKLWSKKVLWAIDRLEKVSTRKGAS